MWTKRNPKAGAAMLIAAFAAGCEPEVGSARWCAGGREGPACSRLPRCFSTTQAGLQWVH